MKTKIVIRKYFSKKLGKMIVKRYEYKQINRRGRVLVNSQGKINQKNVAMFEESIKNNPKYGEAEKRTLVRNLHDRIKERSQNKKRFTTNSFISVTRVRRGNLFASDEEREALNKENRIRRFLANAGYSPEEVAEETGIPVEEILNGDNWDGDIFSFDLQKWKFNFTYTGTFFEVVA